MGNGYTGRRYERSYTIQAGRPTPPPQASAGRLVYVTGPAGLTFGVDPVPNSKTIEFECDGAGAIAAGRLEFSGDTDSFRIISEGADALDTPFACDSGLAFAFALLDGTTHPVEFEGLYTDGTAKTMTVTMYDVDGTQVDEIDATVEITNPFLTLVESDPNMVRAYQADTLAVGTYNNPDSCFVDSQGRANPFFCQQGVGDGSGVVAANGVGAFQNAVAPTAGAVAGTTLIMGSAIGGDKQSFILIVYLDLSFLAGSTQDFFGGDGGPSMALEVTPTQIRSRNNFGGRYNAIPHDGTGWYAICCEVVYDSPIYMSVTKLTAGFSYANMGESTVAASALSLGTGKFNLYAPELIQGTRYANFTLFSDSLTPAEFATYVESLEPTL